MSKDNTGKGTAYETYSRRFLENNATMLGIKKLDPRQGKVPITGKKTTNNWKADHVADKQDGGKIKIECRWKGPKTNAITGEEMGGIAYEDSDCDVEGMVITNKPVQPAADRVATEEKIGIIQLQPGKSDDEYIAWGKNISEHNWGWAGIPECVSVHDSVEIIVTNVETSEVKRYT